MNLTSSEFELRLTNLQCCIATMSNNLLNKIKIGSKDVECKLNELLVIQRMYKYLKCFHTEDSEILATGTIEIDVVVVGDIVDFLINGTSIIGGPRTVANGNVTTLMTNLALLINDSQDTYTAVYNGDKRGGIVEITGTCNNDILTYTFEGSEQSSITVLGLTGGECVENCLTEAQVESMLDYLATKCKHCFTLSI